MGERAFQYTGKDQYVDGVPFPGWMRTGDCYMSDGPLHEGDIDLLAEVERLRAALAARGEPVSLHRFWPSQFVIGSCAECGRSKDSSVHWVARSVP